MSAKICTLQLDGVDINPRTVASAIRTSDGTNIESLINNNKTEVIENATKIAGDISTVLNNILTEPTLTDVNNKIDIINGEAVETSTLDKLNRTEETKELLKSKLTEKGVDIASENNFYNLANKVGEIKVGIDPSDIYNVTVTWQNPDYRSLMLTYFDPETLSQNSLMLDSSNSTGQIKILSGSVYYINALIYSSPSGGSSIIETGQTHTFFSFRYGSSIDITTGG